MYEPLKEQIKKTTRNLERGEVFLADRIFLNHVLDELEFILENDALLARRLDAADALDELIGSCNEIVTDGLED